MSATDVLDGHAVVLARDAADDARARGPVARVAGAGVAAIVLVSPFEALEPVARVPGQALSTVECVVVAACAAAAMATVREQRSAVLWVHRSLPWAALGGAAMLSVLGAGGLAGNALGMAVRLFVLAAVCGLTQVAAPSHQAVDRLARIVFVAGCAVAILVLADFAAVPAAATMLAPFREGIAVVGTQVRASGPFQYPTIASMYLELAFAVGVGLLLQAGGARGRLLMIAGLAMVSEAIVLTFTRSGIITVAVSLAGVTGVAWMRGGARGRLAALAALSVLVVAQVLASRSTEMLLLRMTSEGQGQWFKAVIDAPRTLTVDTVRPVRVPLRVTNAGRATWDSTADEPVRLSYHWIALDSDEVVAWEGYRTAFPAPVRPGQTVNVDAMVGGPGVPGRFRLVWDIEQEHRLWFSTEPGADLTVSAATVTGARGPVPFRSIGPRRLPAPQVRPGRLELWGAAWRMFLAHPLHGVGADNFRLLYGEYSSIAPADPRVHSNNMYLEVLSGMGLIGFAALLWTGRAAIAAARLALRSDLGAGLAAAVAAIAVHGLVDSFLSFTGTYLLMAVTLGLTSAAAGDGAHAHRV